MDWDAVRVPEYIGGRILARLGDETGAVIRDPYGHRVTWLIAPGATADWDVTAGVGVQLLGTATCLDVPPASRVRSPMPHWARPWGPGRGLTDAELLHAVLDEVLARAAREGAAR